MTDRAGRPEVFWPLGTGRRVTSGYRTPERPDHYGVDFGRDGGSANMPVYAIRTGTVIYAGPARGYGGPYPAGWLVVDVATEDGGGVDIYGHIVAAGGIAVGSRVVAGQRIATINPDRRTNGGVDPHLHLARMPYGYDESRLIDPMPDLRGAKEPEAQHMAPKRPFNEYPLWTEANQGRGGKPVTLWLIHTEEGGGPKGGADRLARYCQDLTRPSGAVSYHYYVSQDPDDRGVTVVDGVDTDLASWSVGNANNMSINLCFAGSRAAWTREQWMQQAGAIDAAAYLAVQDSKQYHFPLTVITPPDYRQGRAGISDHNYVTRIIGWGDHTDVGPNFPWDYLAQRVEHWRAVWDGQPAPPPKPPAPQPKPPTPTTDERVRLIHDQLVGPDGKGWPQLGGRTLVDAVAELLKRSGGV